MVLTMIFFNKLYFYINIEGKNNKIYKQKIILLHFLIILKIKKLNNKLKKIQIKTKTKIINKIKILHPQINRI